MDGSTFKRWLAFHNLCIIFIWVVNQDIKKYAKLNVVNYLTGVQMSGIYPKVSENNIKEIILSYSINNFIYNCLHTRDKYYACRNLCELSSFRL